jgi:hypothetical protein
VPVWGNIIVYVTSYLRKFESELTMSETFIVFPITIFVGGVTMQIGA